MHLQHRKPYRADRGPDGDARLSHPGRNRIAGADGQRPSEAPGYE